MRLIIKDGVQAKGGLHFLFLYFIERYRLLRQLAF